MGSPATSRFNVKSEFLLGQYYDGQYYQLNLYRNGRYHKVLKIEGQYQFNSISFPVQRPEIHQSCHRVKINLYVQYKIICWSIYPV